VQVDVMLGAALAAEVKPHTAIAVDFAMTVTQRRQAEAIVGLGVLFVADADQGALQQPYDCRQNLLSWQATLRQVAFHLGANRRQHFAEDQHLAVFVFVPHRPPTWMITILLATRASRAVA
jgi:hypothetical protein